MVKFAGFGRKSPSLQRAIDVGGPLLRRDMADTDGQIVGDVSFVPGDLPAEAPVVRPRQIARYVQIVEDDHGDWSV